MHIFIDMRGYFLEINRYMKVGSNYKTDHNK